jgi:uncharacterized membrane protein YdfJ with MMPL/SSD domain
LFTGIVTLIGSAIVLNKESIAIELIKMVATTYVAPLGSVGLDVDTLVGIRIIWKIPIYKLKL